MSIRQALSIVCYSFEVFMDHFYVLDNALGQEVQQQHKNNRGI